LFPKPVFSTKIKALRHCLKWLKLWAFFYQNFYLGIFAVVKILKGTLEDSYQDNMQAFFSFQLLDKSYQQHW